MEEHFTKRAGGRYFMYGDIYCTDFTHLTYTFTLSAWFLDAL